MEQRIIATELLKGQGLGNQLFCYISTRCLALHNQAEFAILNKEQLANNIHSQKGMYFMDIDCGVDCKKEEFEQIYHEQDDRIFLGNSNHDMTHGCYISGTDQKLFDLKESTLLYGNLQSEDYFRDYKDQIKEWFRVKPEFDHMEYSKENLCIINIRGGEYAGDPALFLRRKYWLDAMKYMRRIRSDMEFMVITDDVIAAKRVLPEVEAYHFDLAGDYTIIKNACYLILSNSSFAFFPAFTSETAKKIIAPKYWARHNVSNGYWSSEQNIYDEFVYMDRHGKLFTAKECREELNENKKKIVGFQRINHQPTGIHRGLQTIRKKYIWSVWMIGRIVRSLKRRVLQR